MSYQLTEDDLAIFEAARHNGSAFTAYYFNQVKADTRDGRHVEGWQFMPYQLRIHHGGEPNQVCVGGFGTGKTAGLAMSAFVWCSLVPCFQFLETAPVAWQANQMYQYVADRLPGSRAERLVVKAITKPYPLIEFYNGSRMQFMSADEQAAKIKTWEGDWVIIDQAEDVDDLESTIRNLGSRLRGRRPDGSPRLGRLTLLANAGDNPALWDFYDQAETLPDEYLSLTIAYDENIYLTAQDLHNLEMRVGGTQEAINQWLKAQRPVGRGDHFPYSLLAPCIDEGLDEIMKRALVNERPGFVYQEAPKCGCVWWEMPPEPGREYLVVGDPGQMDPPFRGSPVILVWDITDFPRSPAYLRCFRWIFGGGSFQPFLLEYQRLVEQYHAHGQNAFDSTGFQKGFDELVFAVQNLLAEGMNISGEKNLMLNSAKIMMGKIMLRFPKISGMVHQLTHYRLPDTKIRQDIVMTVAMSCSWLRRLLWGEAESEEEALGIEVGREARAADRVTRSER